MLVVKDGDCSTNEKPCDLAVQIQAYLDTPVDMKVRARAWPACCLVRCGGGVVRSLRRPPSKPFGCGQAPWDCPPCHGFHPTPTNSRKT